LLWERPGLATTLPPLLFLVALAGLHALAVKHAAGPRLQWDAGLFAAGLGALLLFVHRTDLHFPFRVSYGAMENAAFLLLGVGGMLLGLDAARTRALPFRGAPLFLLAPFPLLLTTGILAPPTLGLLLGPFPWISFGAGWLWLGVALWNAGRLRGTSAAAVAAPENPQPRPASA
jgi:hypothetical protein